MRRTLATAIALVLTGSSATLMAQPASTPTVAATAPATTTQLPRSVRPTHYDVAVTPNAQALSFDGKVGIDIEVVESTAAITLNAAGMTFSQVRLSPTRGKTDFGAPKVSVDEKAQTATFTFAKPVPVGSYRLELSYTGKIGTQAIGLFAIDYETQAGKRRALYTQFETADARKFIPSWDEPAYKATFDLQATVPAAEMAVSNMPVSERVDLGDGRARVRFATSPKMSTYLLFFGLGDFERATAQAGATEVGVVTQKGASAQAAFALAASKAVLEEYNDYFGVPYPLPKLDNIASPGGSRFFSAMENWGAIYTFEHSILLDPRISTQADKQFAFDVAAHEIAHQWFGDLVTMSWWDDLWLNEGFASWMQSRTTAKLHPEWNTVLTAVGVREGAMGRDAVVTTHPVVQHVETVEQASQAFDAITYSKGQAVIAMLENYVGADAWRDGVRRYMKAHAYGNTRSDDLWKEIEAAAGKPITDIAHDFTLQPGVPLIRVASAKCADGKTTLELVQGEFTKDRPDKKPLAWRVPVIAQTIGGEPAHTLVTGGKASLTVPGCGTVVVNAGQRGYYRTLYAPEQLKALRQGFATLPPIDQLGLMKDNWALGMAGSQPASTYLDLASAAPAEADTQIWGEIADTFGTLNNYYRGENARQARFRKFAIARLTPVFERVGWEAKAGEAEPLAILRTNLIKTLSDLGDQKVIAEARRRYAADASDPKAVPAALRKAILGIVARHADAADWDRLHTAAKNEKTPLVKDELYSLLASTQDPALAQRALDLALTDEPGATNGAGMLSVVSRLHPDLAFDFAAAHRQQIDVLVDATLRSRYYPVLANGSFDAAMIGKIKAFADANIAASSRRSAETVIANIEYARQVRAQRLPEIDAWLKAHGG